MNGGRRNRRWQKGGYTLNEPKRYDIATVRSPERKKASGIGGDRQKEGRHTPNTPEGTVSPRFGSLKGGKRPEAAVIDPNRHTKHTSSKKTISPQFGGLHVVGQAGLMVARESRHMLTYAKTKSKAGSKVDGLWTAKSGHAEKP